MTLGVIVQARMGSTRLPGKVLLPVNGRPLLSHVIGRLNTMRHDAKVVVATSEADGNEVIEHWSAQNGVTCYRGHESDVLDRFHRCAVLHGMSHIVRLTADNPFTDIEELDRLIDFHIGGGYDYCEALYQMPLGVGSEIFSFEALERSHREGQLAHHREHVNEYLIEYPERFRIGCLEIGELKRRPDIRLTVDTADDLIRADMLASRAEGRWLTTEEAIALCSSSA